jgi:hypothetical protein
VAATVARTVKRFLHHDDTPNNTSPVVKEFLAETNILVIAHPLYSRDLAASDLRLFLDLKMVLKAIRFMNVESKGWKLEHFK